MESLNLIRPVLVKVKVTESFKAKAAAEHQNAIRRLEMEMEHIDIQEKRLVPELEKKNPEGVSAARQTLNQEKGRMTGERQKLLQRLKEIGKLALDSEVILGKMESPVTLQVGDDWSRVMNVEIILKDGIIIEIRQGGAGVDRVDV
jgi:hypothetical protein